MSCRDPAADARHAPAASARANSGDGTRPRSEDRRAVRGPASAWRVCDGLAVSTARTAEEWPRAFPRRVADWQRFGRDATLRRAARWEDPSRKLAVPLRPLAEARHGSTAAVARFPWRLPRSIRDAL